MTGQGIPNMGRSVQDWRRQTQGNLRRLGPILLEIFEENVPRLRRWDQQLTDWVRSHRWGWIRLCPRWLSMSWAQW